MDENSGISSGPVLIEQPHGGALLTGGVKGNSGGPGRPPNQFRLKSAQTYSKLNDLVDRKVEKWTTLENADEIPTDQIKGLMDTTGRFGLGDAKVVVDDEMIDKVMQVIEEHCPDQAQVILQDLLAKLKEG